MDKRRAEMQKNYSDDPESDFSNWISFINFKFKNSKLCLLNKLFLKILKNCIFYHQDCILET